MEEALISYQPICVNAIVEIEILQGIRNERSLECIIAANCLIDNFSIAHKDRDFDSIKKVYPKLDTIKLNRK